MENNTKNRHVTYLLYNVYIKNKKKSKKTIMGNKGSSSNMFLDSASSNMFLDPETTVLVTVPPSHLTASRTIPLIPTDAEVMRRHQDSGNVDKVTILTYNYPERGQLPSIDEAKTTILQGRSLPGSFAVLLQDIWKKRNSSATVTIVNAKLNTGVKDAINDLTIRSRLLIVGDLGKQTMNVTPRGAEYAPVLFGKEVRHTTKEVAAVLIPALEKMKSTLLNCLSVSLYYVGDCDAFCADLMEELARKPAYICLRAIHRVPRYHCKLYFNKIAIRQFNPCPQ